MNVILNLTQHTSTPEQGCLDLTGETLAKLKALLTFDTLPVRGEVVERARAIAKIAGALADQEAWQGNTCEQAMIGGAPFLMGALEAALLDRGIEPVYAFSVRESTDEVQPDGSVRKVAVFRHKGYVSGAA